MKNNKESIPNIRNFLSIYNHKEAKLIEKIFS